MDEKDSELLELCKKEIEKKYHFGNGHGYVKQRDFEYLIDLIEETCGTKLSISTLKRIWRKGEEQNPHPSTLNALVSVLGYKDWLEFKLRYASPGGINPVNKKGTNLLNKKGAIVIGLVLMLSTISFLYLNADNSEFPDSDEILFVGNKTVSKGVPSTVIFNYDVSEIEADSFFIQQDWNPNHRDRIDPKNNFFSSIYYVPGYHKAKLVANETFLKTIPIHIQTDGWMSAAFYNYDDRPVYIMEDQNQDGILAADKNDILGSNLDIERFSELRFINIREYPGIDGHNFIAETRFRYREFLFDPCPEIRLTIHTEAHIYFVPVTLKGCESNIAIKIGEDYQEGRDNDLSAFGTDIYNWQDLTLVVEDKTGKVFLNGSEIYETTFLEDFGEIKGLDFRTSGLIEVDYILLKDIEGNLVFQDSF
ncbi:MAG: hypothetical protein JJ971_07800 [Balneolaceae bacterium]|nr:hypothetical protein [Balneolaceae bacterium]MBO6546861.1 hypothetical protein [Balneolaceae bacterium]MBO6649221.1 hypothetical protein [Balneolaceae bacterium]